MTQTIRGLARDKRTVIASIHQPSSEVFELFDKLCLLSRGRTVYFGEASKADEARISFFLNHQLLGETVSLVKKLRKTANGFKYKYTDYLYDS